MQVTAGRRHLHSEFNTICMLAGVLYVSAIWIVFVCICRESSVPVQSTCSGAGAAVCRRGTRQTSLIARPAVAFFMRLYDIVHIQPFSNLPATFACGPSDCQNFELNVQYRWFLSVKFERSWLGIPLELSISEGEGTEPGGVGGGGGGAGLAAPTASKPAVKLCVRTSRATTYHTI